MNKTFTLKSSLVIAALLALPVAQAAKLGKDEYKAGKDSISAAYKADKKACDALSGNAKDVCTEEAKAKQKVARAELEYNYTGKAGDQAKVLKTKADTTYAIAKEKCDDKAGNDKDVCVKEAKAAQTKARADAKSSKQVGAARAEAGDDKRDADYKVAREKCDSLSGDAKDGCVAAAKSKFGKS